MIYLSDKDINNALSYFDTEDIVDTMMEMFADMNNGDYVLGGAYNASHGMRISVEKEKGDRIFIAMPAYLGGNYNVCGVKWHGPNRPVEGNDADSYFTMILNDPESGKPFAIMNADTITSYRTAAVNMVAIEKLKPDSVEKIAMVGPGKINTITIQMLLNKISSVKEVVIKGRGQKSRDKTISYLQELYPAVKFVASETLKEAITDADIGLINAGFYFDDYKDMPIIRAQWIKAGSLFVCPSYANFPDTMLMSRDVAKVCDFKLLYKSYGEELGHPTYKRFGSIGCKFYDLIWENKINEEDVIDLPEIVTKKNLEDYVQKIKIFSSSGLPLEDIALGYKLYKKCIEKGIGLNI